MDTHKDFEIRKEEVLKSLENYAMAINTINVEELEDFDKRKLLIERYADLVEKNSSYRNFILDLSKPKMVNPDVRVVPTGK